VAIGCFILFGASSIAEALAGFTSFKEGSSRVATAETVRLLPQQLTPGSPLPYDPYAGASVPNSR
jgi:hypothetical protein